MALDNKVLTAFSAPRPRQRLRQSRRHRRNQGNRWLHLTGDEVGERGHEPDDPGFRLRTTCPASLFVGACFITDDDTLCF